MKRGLYKTEAVVLNSIDFGESDKILAFYTSGYGKVKGIAKGARRSRKRFVGNLEPSAHIRLIFFHNPSSELVRVEDATLLEGYNGLRGDIQRFSEACYLLELVTELTREGQVSTRVFDLLTCFLAILRDTPETSAFLRYFEVRLLALLGYMPHLQGCVVCSSALGAAVRPSVYFSSERGGTVCGNCSTGIGGLIPVSAGTAGLLATAARFDAGKLGRLKPNPAFLRESEVLLEDFIKAQLGKELKTKKFMDKLRGASF